MDDLKRVRISCDPVTAREIAAFIRTQPDCSLSIETPERNLSGVEIIGLVTDLTSAATGLLSLWLTARPHLKSRIDVEPADALVPPREDLPDQ